MNEEERKRFMKYVSQINLQKLMEHAKRNDVNFPHINCRSSIEPLPPKMQVTVNPSGKSEAFELFDHKIDVTRHRNSVVSWESLAGVIGAKSVAAIRSDAQ